MNDKQIIFTQEELQLIYAACMSYGDKLAEIKKSIPHINWFNFSLGNILVTVSAKERNSQEDSLWGC